MSAILDPVTTASRISMHTTICSSYNQTQCCGTLPGRATLVCSSPGTAVASSGECTIGCGCASGASGCSELRCRSQSQCDGTGYASAIEPASGSGKSQGTGRLIELPAHLDVTEQVIEHANIRMVRRGGLRHHSIRVESVTTPSPVGHVKASEYDEHDGIRMCSVVADAMAGLRATDACPVALRSTHEQ